VRNVGNSNPGRGSGQVLVLRCVGTLIPDLNLDQLVHLKCIPLSAQNNVAGGHVMVKVTRAWCYSTVMNIDKKSSTVCQVFNTYTGNNYERNINISTL